MTQLVLRRRTNIALVALLLSACDPGDGAPGDAAVAQVVDAAAAEAMDAPAALQPIWGPSSQHLEIRCSGWSGASSRFAASREQLTQAQLTAAGALLARLSGREDPCYFDGASCLVDIVAADGGRTTVEAPYQAECDASYRLIPWASLSPLLDALDCRLGERGRPLRPNLYCEHGLDLFSRYDPLVHVAEPGAYALELGTCGQLDRNEPPRMQVLDQAGALVVEARAPADPGPRNLCLHAVHSFAQAGLYRLKISGVAGEDFKPPMLRFTRAAAP